MRPLISRANACSRPAVTLVIATENETDPKLRSYVANMVYVGALAQLLGIEMLDIERALLFHFRGKRKPVKYRFKTCPPSFRIYLASYRPDADPDKYWHWRGETEQARLALEAQNARCYGDLAGCALVLRGQAEAWIEAGVKIWDLAPLQILVEEAGGRFTDLEGRSSIAGGGCLASNGLVHPKVLRALGR